MISNYIVLIAGKFTLPITANQFILLQYGSTIFAAHIMGCLAEFINFLILLKEGLRLYPLKEKISFINLIRIIPA